MNAPRPLFPNVRSAARLPLAWAVLCGAGILLPGCIGNPFVDAKVDPASPVAAEVAKVAKTNTDYPSFADIPAIPTDLRPVGLYGREAQVVKLAGEQLVRETAPETWTLKNTESFAADAQRDAGPRYEEGPARDPEAFARELRERATPPPPR
jgi:hypothetical protein